MEEDNILRSKKDRIWQRIQDIAKFGKNNQNGITRFPFTTEYKQAIDLIIKWMEEADLIVRRDSIGNIIGRRKGNRNNPIIMTGSHIDTVENGGKFDGVTGVIAGLEALEILKENNITTELPIELVILINEEGSRFPGGLMGSMAITGRLPRDFPYKIKDIEGISLADEMKKNGIDPNLVTEALYKEEVRAFFELHIEQASVLENSDKPIGIVSDIAGVSQFKLTINGRSGHAGATPMNNRRDPMVASGLVIKEVENLAIRSKSGMRGTIGYIKAFPGGHNIIPERVELTIDFRYIDEEEHKEFMENLEEYIKKICKHRGLSYELFSTQKAMPVHIDLQILNLLEKIAKDHKIPHEILPSWAAHDAMIMNDICSIGMIFIRSQKGLSHCPEEFSSPDDIAKGADLLMYAIERTANKYI